MSWDWSFVASILPKLGTGLLNTIIATALGSVIGVLLGLLLAILQTLNSRVTRGFVRAYIYVIRGTPILIQLYSVFYLFPSIGVTLSPMQAGFLTLAINFSSYFCETFRGGIQSVPRGQWEAARALNLSTPRTWLTVVLPQALRPIVPALGNYVNLMFKVSALLSTIAVQELFGTATIIGNSVYRYLEPMTIVGVLYLVVSIPVTLIVRKVEKRTLSRG